jgi:peptide-methionine (S)-S-oxide reductase
MKMSLLRLPSISFTLGVLFSFQACGSPEPTYSLNNDMEIKSGQITDTAYLAAGCFWCIEAIFQQLNGVISVTSGYTGGTVKNPSYKEVCTGSTGHAEAARIVYDPSVLSFDELLEVFWKTHDPTTLNRQGADVGTQYRSGIYYISDKQKETAEKYKSELDAAGAFDAPIVTEILPFDEKFYVAEDYHQNYYNQNGEQGYCRMVIQPKVEKFRKVFGDKLKK